MKKNYGLVAASTIAALLSSSQTFAAVKIVDGHYCSNNCKGQSDCGGMGNNNGCHGQNECKGQGWKDAADEKECLKVGGKWAKVPSANDDKKSESQNELKSDTKTTLETKNAPTATNPAQAKTDKKSDSQKSDKKQKSDKSSQSTDHK